MISLHSSCSTTRENTSHISEKNFSLTITIQTSPSTMFQPRERNLYAAGGALEKDWARDQRGNACTKSGQCIFSAEPTSGSLLIRARREKHPHIPQHGDHQRQDIQGFHINRILLCHYEWCCGSAGSRREGPRKGRI